jgi:hypothetical protein
MATSSHTGDRPTALKVGRIARARFGEGILEGRIVEVREEPTGDVRVVLKPFGDDCEVDTAAERVALRDPTTECPACGVVWPEQPAYRCPDCGTDLVG